MSVFFFFFNDTATTEIYTLSLHDALPISESTDLLKDVKYVIFSIPSQAPRSVIQKFSSQIRGDMILVNTAKGIEIATGMRLSEVMRDEILGKYHKNIVVLSGRTHAEEVSKGFPTTIVAAVEEQK